MGPKRITNNSKQSEVEKAVTVTVEDAGEASGGQLEQEVDSLRQQLLDVMQSMQDAKKRADEAEKEKEAAVNKVADMERQNRDRALSTEHPRASAGGLSRPTPQYAPNINSMDGVHEVIDS